MAARKSTRATKARSTTLYLGVDVVDKLDFFADATVRSKSQAAEYLIRMGLERFIETGQEQPKDEPTLPKRRGRQPKPISMNKVIQEPEATEELPETAAPVNSKPATKKPAAKRRGRPRKKAA